MRIAQFLAVMLIGLALVPGQPLAGAGGGGRDGWGAAPPTAIPAKDPFEQLKKIRKPKSKEELERLKREYDNLERTKPFRDAFRAIRRAMGF